MSNYIEEQLKTAVCGEYDVIVAGGGPAGIGAAISAARGGMKTLLIEKHAFLGGMWTAGLVNPIFDYRNKKGIMKEIIEKLKEQNAFGGFMGDCFQYEVMKNLLDNLVKNAGVTTLFHTYISKTITEGNTVKGIITENKDGRCAYLAKKVIDCTGDADVAVSAGAEYFMGREEDNKVQPMTMMFVLGNINYMQTDASQLYTLMKDATEKYNTNYTIPYNFPYIIQIPERNEAVVQLTHIRNVNGTNAKDLSFAEMDGRKQVNETVNFLKKYIPQFKDVQLLYTGTQIGVRETRRIVGEYILNCDDLVCGRKFEDAIALAEFGIDIHNPDDSGQEVIKIEPYQIPYRCLLPKEIDNLLVAGRCISGTHEAFSAYRVTGNCVAMGEAAGKAAAISIKNNIDLRKVSAKDIDNI